jgi:ABC-2 type transport system permease protein
MSDTARAHEATTPPHRRNDLLTQVRAVVRLSTRQLVRTRRTALFALVGVVPPALGLLFAVFRRIPSLHVNITGWDFFSFMMVGFFLHFFLILVALFYGTYLIHAEVEDRTLTYLICRPVTRPALVLGKFCTYLATAWLLILPSMVLTFLILEISDGLTGLARHLPYLLWDASVLVLGTMAYGALFTLLGAAVRRPVMAGLFFAFVWEWLVTYIPGRFGKFTVLHYLLSLFPHSTVQRGVQTLFDSLTSRPVAILALLGITGVFLSLAIALFTRREYVLEQ